jgi:hypothetical protein
MGTTADINGISVQFVDKNNKATDPPIFGAFAHLHGIPRKQALRLKPLAAGEQKGSEHWMTLLAVADSQERLDELVSTSDALQGDCHTSCASHRVQIAIHVGDNEPQWLENRSVIASGPITKMNPPEVNVVHVKVLPKNAVVTKQSPVAKEFIGSSPFSAQGIKAAAASIVKTEAAAAKAKAAAAATAASRQPRSKSRRTLATNGSRSSASRNRARIR